MVSAFTSKQRSLLNALHQVETGGEDEPPYTAGDGGTRIGPYQIYSGYFQDSGVGGRHQDCEGNDAVNFSERVVNGYMTRYAKGKWTSDATFDAEVCARIHNGGPKGATKQSTNEYWVKVKNILNR